MLTKNFKLLFFYFLTSFIATLYIFGFENISFTNSNWLMSTDMTSDLVSWKYFKNDIWRFPIGSNPNFGMGIGSGIVFSGSVPFLSFLFKIFGDLLPDNFHFFSLWIFICFFLQSYISFLIIYHHTKDLTFSIIGSLFFLLSPIFINRISLHLSLSAHWLILLGFYIETKKEVMKKIFYWTALISLSALIHFYFTIILLGIYFLFIFNEYLISLNNSKLITQIAFPFTILFIIMYVFGYFEVPITDALGYGYGHYKLNLTSIINPASITPIQTIDWSLILPALPQNTSGEYEGFNYLGIGGILLLIIIFSHIFFNFNELKNKKYRPYLLIVTFFSLFALTNKISFANITLIDFELPKYILGIVSICRASGRFFWPVYYLIFLGSILLVYIKYSKKISLYILIFVLSLQIVDISAGLKEYFNSNGFINEEKDIDHSFWEKLSRKNHVLRTTYLNNETFLIRPLRKVLLSQNYKSTDISRHGRYNRKKASIIRTDLYKSFNKGIIDKDTVFVVDNINHLRNLKYLFEDKNVGFFLRDNVWVLVADKKNEMTNFDKNELKKYVPIILPTQKKLILNYKDEKSIHGLGWTHNLNNPGIWTEGSISTLLFTFNETMNENYTIDIKFGSIITLNDKAINFSIIINDLFTKDFSLKNINELDNNSIKLNLKNELISNSINSIKFEIKNPISPLELFQSPDARKLGVLVESIEISNY